MKELECLMVTSERKGFETPVSISTSCRKSIFSDGEKEVREKQEEIPIRTLA
jgi:hypothetical protein